MLRGPWPSGYRAAQRMGLWLRHHGVCLNAASLPRPPRAGGGVEFARGLALELKTVTVHGHLPGLEQLLIKRCGEDQPAANGKRPLAPSAVTDEWRRSRGTAGRLIAITRPEEL